MNLSQEIIEKTINTIEDAKAFIKHLSQTGHDFHLEDDVKDVINGVTGEPLFSNENVVHVDARQDEIYNGAFNWGDHECPIGYLIDVNNGKV